MCDSVVLVPTLRTLKLASVLRAQAEGPRDPQSRNELCLAEAGAHLHPGLLGASAPPAPARMLKWHLNKHDSIFELLEGVGQERPWLTDHHPQPLTDHSN